MRQGPTILSGYAGWPGLSQVFRLKRERIAKGKTTVEVVYGITSLTRDEADAPRLLGLIRRHWGIEIPQSEDSQGDNLCAAGRAGYHRRGGPARAGRLVRPATGTRSLLMFAEEFDRVPPRARPSRRPD